LSDAVEKVVRESMALKAVIAVMGLQVGEAHLDAFAQIA
jgi:hypothetical protein